MSQHAQQYPQQPYGQQPYTQQFPAQQPAPVPARTAPKQRRWPWVVGIVVAFLLGISVGGAGNGTNTSPSTTAAGGSAYTPVPLAPASPKPSSASVQQAPAPAPAPTGPATSFSDGMHQVGEDVEPGRYKTPGPDGSSVIPMCYWERAKNDSGEFSAIIANDNIQGPGSLTLKAGEFVKVSGGCTWTKQ